MIRATTAAAMALALLSACGEARQKNPPASSSYVTQSEAIDMITRAWLLDASGRPIPGHLYSIPSATGSMAPTFDHSSVILLETVRAGDIRQNDIIVLNEGPGRENVCHRVTTIQGNSLFMTGDNAQTDGAFPANLVKFRVAGVIFTKRP